MKTIILSAILLTSCNSYVNSIAKHYEYGVVLNYTDKKGRIRTYDIDFCDQVSQQNNCIYCIVQGDTVNKWTGVDSLKVVITKVHRN